MDVLEDEYRRLDLTNTNQLITEADSAASVTNVFGSSDSNAANTADGASETGASVDSIYLARFVRLFCDLPCVI